MLKRPFIIFQVSFLILAGCAYTPQAVRSPYQGQDTPAGQCADFFAALDQELKQAGIRDPGEFRWSVTCYGRPGFSPPGPCGSGGDIQLLLSANVILMTRI